MRIPQLDAERTIRRLGWPLTVDGPCPGGEVGAFYVRWPDGRRAVLSAASGAAARFAGIARGAGVPVPAYEKTALLDDRVIVVQEFLPGVSPEPRSVTGDLLGQLIDCVGRMAGLLPWSAAPLYLTADGPGFCLHEPVARYDRRTARLLDRVREVGRDRDLCDGPDLVHFDFHPGNVLVHDGRVSAILDWDGASGGDRFLSLITLRFYLGATPDLDGILAAVPADRLRAYWAHMALRQVDWSIRHHTPSDVDHWLTVSEAFPA